MYFLIGISFILLTQNAFATPGRVKVFDPDSKTHLNNDRLRDSSSADQFEEAYLLKQAPEITGIGSGHFILRNPNIVLGGFEPPSNAMTVSTDRKFHFSRGEQGFLDSMAFYRLDRNIKYIKSLGFTGEEEISITPLKVDSNAP